jgi:hypothetical protein
MKTTIDMARESWLDTYGLGKDHNSFVEALERFEALVRADEREACADLIEVYPEWLGDNAKRDIAAAIRNRGNK